MSITGEPAALEYRVTFGQKYPREPHPTFGKAHRDGWVTIVAADYDTARACVTGWLGTAWCDMYGPESWPQVAHYFPLGELHRIDASETAG